GGALRARATCLGLVRRAPGPVNAVHLPHAGDFSSTCTSVQKPAKSCPNPGAAPLRHGLHPRARSAIRPAMRSPAPRAPGLVALAFAGLALAGLALAGCGHPASRAECDELFAKNAEIELRSQHLSDPATVADRIAAARAADGDTFAQKCVGRRITTR